MSNSLDPKQAASSGLFVKAVTTMYLADPNNLCPTPTPQDIPPGWELSAWINMSDFFFDIVAPKFYGIVVQETANPDNRIIAIRGTQGLIEWFDDATSIVMVPFKQVPSAGRVAFGFDNIYSTLKVVPVPSTTPGSGAAVTPELTGSFADQLEQLAILRETERGVVHKFAAGSTRRERPTVVTGHSLGSSLATLFVVENSVKNAFDVSLISTLASPKVGNIEFKQFFDALPITSWRIVNTRDLVPQLPPGSDFAPVDVAYSFDSGPFVNEKQPGKPNYGCYHSIDTYLHWLNTALPLASTCVPE
jgi:triacylglycerol lipase